MRLQRDYPRTIVVNDNLWRVKFCRRIVDEGIECYGLCDSETKTISILMGLTPRMRLATFLHEYVHAVEFETGRFIPSGHKAIAFLEDPLADFLLENFWMAPIVWKDAG